ncbi:hypothetical protein [Pantoea sp. BAV 3049]|uniref:hypothetical protein n=1 Tax=Pantoea sp. BAV 3049 TaxID=2654188 RepID=UPI00131E4CE5|nr:hypothetical protein [Pantoea sp. BAV 3049]
MANPCIRSGPATVAARRSQQNGINEERSDIIFGFKPFTGLSTAGRDYPVDNLLVPGESPCPDGD